MKNTDCWAPAQVSDSAGLGWSQEFTLLMVLSDAPIAGLGNHTFKNHNSRQLTTSIHKYTIPSTFSQIICSPYNVLLLIPLSFSCLHFNTYHSLRLNSKVISSIKTFPNYLSFSGVLYMMTIRSSPKVNFQRTYYTLFYYINV